MISKSLGHIIMNSDDKESLCHRISCSLLLVVFSLLSFLPMQAQEKKKNDTLDFRLCFELLTKNRKAYNQYNDSIYIIQDHAKWVNYFKRRAIKNHQLFVANQEIIRSVKEFLQQNNDSIPKDLYVDFCNSLQRGYVSNSMSDPFVLLTMCKYLERGGNYLPDSVKGTNVFNLWKLHSYVQMWNLGGKREYLEEAYKAGTAILSDESKKYPHRDYAIAGALRFMPKTMWVAAHLQTVDEFYGVHCMLSDFLQRPDAGQYLSSLQLNELRFLHKNRDEALLRNALIDDTTYLDKAFRDSLLQVVLKRSHETSHRPSLSHARHVYFLMKSGHMTSRRAWESMVENYERIRGNFIYKDILDDREVAHFMMPFYTFFDVNDVADVPLKKKRRIVWRMCNDIALVYRNRKDFQETTDYVKDLYRLATSEKVLKYLSDKQISKFLNNLCVATQITTYAHCVHVGKIAQLLMKAILEHRPDLLVGVWGCKNVAEVRSQEKHFMDFIYNASILHDLGKIAVASVVNNEYLPLSNEEFDIIKQHPVIGAMLSDRVPRFAKYHDTILGHHKWYNGKGGYPMSFDNTKSPVRILIDIITLSDCMQAATEKVGRNYKIGKQYEVVMSELRKGAGIQYNPDLVKLIDQHPKLSKRLENLIGDGWVDIYYRIYSKFFQSVDNLHHLGE